MADFPATSMTLRYLHLIDMTVSTIYNLTMARKSTTFCGYL